MAAAKNPLPRDDDWGKLASELLGINLGGEGDLDLSDLEPPPPPAPPVPPKIETPPPAASPAPAEIDLADMDFEAEEPDLGDEDELNEEEVAEEYESAQETEDEENEDEITAEVSEIASEAKDDFWDALESWDWETSEEASAPASEGAERPRRSDDRGRRGGRDRDRGGSRRDRSERGFREDRPARPEGERSPRSDRSAGDRRERRPEPRAERPKRTEPPSASRPERAPRQELPGDEFGAGVVDEPTGLGVPAWEDAEPLRERPVRQEPRRVEEHFGSADDDFSAGLLDGESDEVGEVEPSAAGVPEEAERPRRRRRRRRRRSSGERATSPAANVEEAESISPVESDVDVYEDGYEDVETAPTRQGVEDAAGEERREPRGRRRRRRRPGDRGSRPVVREDQAEVIANRDVDAGDELEPVEEPVVAMTYEDVPTWEEAISYLLKPAGEGRRDGGYRSGPPRRR